jgi:hypothetical protein
MMPGFSFSKKRFVLSIGDKGTTLSYINDNKLIKHIFTKNDDKERFANFQAILSKDTNAPVLIVLDDDRQTYQKQNFTAISTFSISAVVNKKLESEYSEDFFIGALKVERNNFGSRDWTYYLVSCEKTQLIDDWINFLVSKPNPLAGIYVSPVESITLLKEIRAQFLPIQFEATVPGRASSWQIFVYRNLIGGQRHVIYKNDAFMFTRLLQSPVEESAEYIAGNVEQNIKDTIEQLESYGYSKTDTLDIFVITTTIIREHLIKSRLNAQNLIICSPHEVSTKLKYDNTATLEKRTVDELLAVNIANDPRVLALHNPILSKAIKYHSFNRFALYPTITIAPVAAIYFLFILYQTVSLTETNDFLLRELSAKDTSISEAEENLKSVNNIGQVIELLPLYKRLAGNSQTPRKIFNQLSYLDNQNIDINKIEWRNDNIGTNLNPTYISTTRINLDFIFQSSSHKALFKKFDMFIKDIHSKFKDYNIEYSRIASRVINSHEDSKIPINITITETRKGE